MTYWHDIVPLISRTKSHITSLPEASEHMKPKHMKPERIKEVLHPKYQILALIMKHSPTRFEIRYYGDFKNSQESGWRLSVPEDILTEKGRSRFEMLTYADSVESAELIAYDELEQLAVIHEAEIVPRNGGISQG